MQTPYRPPGVFRSVLCAADDHVSGSAARRQAVWLAGDDHAVEFIPPALLTMETADDLLRRCAAHDLLVLGCDAEARALVRRLPIPVLFARWCPASAEVTDAILVVVDHRTGAARAAELAAKLASRDGGSVSMMALPGDLRELTRALSAAGRIVLQATGSTARIVGEPAPAWLEVPRAAAASGASLVVLGVGDDAGLRESAYDIARHAGCSVLIAPAPQPAEPRPTPSRFERRALTARPRAREPVHSDHQPLPA